MPRAKPAPERAWAADTVERRSVKSLLAYPRNPRTHSEQQVEQLAASMKEYGWTIPVLVDERGVVIAGHGRLQAAAKLGIDEVPVMVARGWTDQQKASYRIWDNQSGLLSGWDEDMLRLELTDLKLEGYDLSLTGFDDVQLVQFMAGVPSGADPEATPEPPVNPVTRRGDLWNLGDHRILCGDSTDTADVERLLDSSKPMLMATDPPYLVDYDGGNHPQSFYNKKGTLKTTWDSYQEGAVESDLLGRFLKIAIPHLHPRCPIYMWHASIRGDLVFKAFRDNEILLHQIIIWKKERGVLTRCHFMWDFEPAAYGWVRGNQPENDRRPPGNARTVWEIDQKGENDGIHPTQKPVEIFKRPIEYHTRHGEVCYEPFSGSGTQIIASEMTSRRCRAMELEPSYVDAALLRWQTFSGKEATLDAPGKPTYAEIQVDRAKPAPKRKRAPRAAERVPS